MTIQKTIFIISLGVILAFISHEFLGYNPFTFLLFYFIGVLTAEAWKTYPKNHSRG